MLHGSTAALAEWILAFADNITDIICEMPVGSIAFPLMMECSLVFLSLGWTFCLLGQANIYTICTVDPEPRYIQYGEYLPSNRHKMESMVTGIRDDEGVAILDQLLGPRPSWSPKGSRVDPYQGVDEWVRSWMWYRSGSTCCLIRDEYTCQICGDPIEDNAQVHHIIWKCHNGTDHPKNLMAVCEDCH